MIKTSYTDEQLVRLVDNTISTKTEYSTDDFTGGSVQVGITQHGNIAHTVHLFFGYDEKRNSISFKEKISSELRHIWHIAIEKKVSMIMAERSGATLNELNALMNMDDPSEFVTKESVTKKKGKGKGKGIGIGTVRTNNSTNSVTNTKLVDGNDTQKHRPNAVWNEMLENDKLKDDMDTELYVELATKFIKYRDEMYRTTKETKYALKTQRGVIGFMNEMKEVDNVDRAFEIMEENEWATFKREYAKKIGGI